MSVAADRTLLVPRPNYGHLARLTDATAVFEHAWFTIPRWEHGYCVDDNARALIVCSLADPAGEAAGELGRIAATALSFLRAASLNGCPVRTRIDYQRSWVDEGAVPDSDGRLLWALGVAAAHHPSPQIRIAAAQLFVRTAPTFDTDYPRSIAFACLGAVEGSASKEISVAEWHDGSSRELGPSVSEAGAALLHRLLPRLARSRDDVAWPWPEDRLTYANATLCEALIAVGATASEPELVAEGVALLSWLHEREWKGTHFSFTTQRGMSASARHEPPTRTSGSQQPIEAASMADACWRAWKVTGDSRWAERTFDAAAWFLGRNDAGLGLYDASSGAGADGLIAPTPSKAGSINPNCGAESTIAALMALQRARSLTHRPHLGDAPSRYGADVPRRADGLGLGTEEGERVEEFAFVDHGRTDASVGRSVDEVDGVVVDSMNALHEHHFIDVANAFPLEFGLHDRRWEHGATAAGIGIEQRHVHRVHAIGSTLVEEQQETGLAGQGRSARANTEASRRRPDDHMVMDLIEVALPIAGVGVPHLVEVIEHRDLHVGVNAVHQHHTAVGQVEDNRVFVGQMARPEDRFAGVVHDEPFPIDDETVRADLPRTARPLMGKAGVGHHHVIDPGAGHALHARVFDCVHVALAAQQDMIEGVGDAVVGCEQQHVAHIVVEPGAAFGAVIDVGSVPVTDTSNEEMILPGVMHEPGVEERAIPGGVAGLQEWDVAESTGTRHRRWRRLGAMFWGGVGDHHFSSVPGSGSFVGRVGSMVDSALILFREDHARVRKSR